MRLAGIASLTIAPDLLRTLSKMEELESELVGRSLVLKKTENEDEGTEYKTFINDETEYRKGFAESDGGKGQVKTAQVYAPSSLYLKGRIC